jgi:predicted acyltransferase
MLVDVRQIGLQWFKPLEIMGLNALFAFVGSVFMIKVIYFNNINGCGDKATTVYSFLRQSLFGWSGESNSAVLFALAAVLLWMLICFGMYRRNWLIKL